MMEGKPDIFLVWCPLINFCRCCGIIPLKRNDTPPYFQRCAGSSCFNISMILCYLFIFIVSVLLFRDTAWTFGFTSIVAVETSKLIGYYAQSLLTFGFFSLNAGEIVSLLLEWIDLEMKLGTKGIRLGLGTKIQCWVICVVTLFAFTTENALYFISELMMDNVVNWKEGFKNFAGRGAEVERYFGSYTYVYGITVALMEIISEAGWILGDCVIAVISVLLHRHYRALQERHLEDENVFFETHLAISELVRKTSKLFSPLILFTTGLDIYYILTFLYCGLEADISSSILFVRLNFVLTFFYLLGRFSMSAILASRLAEIPLKAVTEYFYSRPSLIGSSTDAQQGKRLIRMEMFIQEIRSEQIGLAGGGFFMLTKKSTSTLFSLIITYEVILLKWPSE